MADDWLSNIDPDDIAEIRNLSEIIEHEQDGIRIVLHFEEAAALDFIETLDNASEGNLMSVFKMLSFIEGIGEILYRSLKGDIDDNN